MDEFNLLFESTVFVIGAIIQLILIIVFIKLAIFFAKIKQYSNGQSNQVAIQ
jgi:hypothetical protein